MLLLTIDLMFCFYIHIGILVLRVWALRMFQFHEPDKNSTLFCFFLDQTEGIWSVDQNSSKVALVYSPWTFASVGALYRLLFLHWYAGQLRIVRENLTFLLMILSGLGIGGTVTLIGLVIKDYVGEDVFSKLHPMTSSDISLMATNSQHVSLGSTRVLRNQCPFHYCRILVSN
jgi:hypothetical protein